MPSHLPQLLASGLVLRVVESDADAEQVISLNAQIHGAEVGDILRHWMFVGHPTLSRGDWLFVEDPSVGQAVATLSFMPLKWIYGCQTLPVAELGFVATSPDYRRRGLQRALSNAFDQMALDRGFTLAAIEGIPGFYGQFGYEYAIPLVGGYHLEYEQVVDAPKAIDTVIRRATPADIIALQSLYESSIARLDLAAPRSFELWMHQVTVPQHRAMSGTTTVMEQNGRVVGYVRWSDDDWTDRLRILELAVDDGPGVRERIMMALRFARQRGEAADKRGLTLQLPESHPAVEVARYLGAIDGGHYGWQMKVLNPAAFLHEIKPALETRLDGSVLAGYSGALVFDLYRSCLALRFEAGELLQVNAVTDDAHSVQADARMSLKQATQLWLGWRCRKAMERWYPDVWSRVEAQHLLDVLFPKAQAYIYMPY
jgi:predicted N-acetyltransferase YhbS